MKIFTPDLFRITLDFITQSGYNFHVLFFSNTLMCLEYLPQED